MKIFFIFIFSILLSLCFSLIVRKISFWLNIVDKPGKERKIHKKNTPLLGGVAIFLAFFIVLYFVRDELIAGDLELHHWIGVFIGACFLMVGGFLDDKYSLKPQYQVIWPVLAGLSVIAGGVSIERITNPLGDFIYLGQFSAILIILWLAGMMYTTKLLDGIDGLVTGITAIGGVILFLFTMTTKYYQPDIGLAALILAGACLGFLILNWHPAKIFLGEGGSLLLGYILGVLAIISGGKFAIALLIMGIPIMDAGWTIIRRISAGKNPFKSADKKHLHFQILDLGLSQKQTVLIYYGLASIFGISALFLQTAGKLIALVVLVLIMMLAIVGMIVLHKNRIN